MNEFVNQGYPYNQYGYQQPPQQFYQQPPMQPQVQEPGITITMGSNSSIGLGPDKDPNVDMTIKTEVPITTEPKKKRGRPRKNEVESVKSSDIIKADKKTEVGEIIDTPTSYSYAETTNMLKDTLLQIDVLNSELMEEFESVKRSRTMKNKYNTLVGLSQNVGTLLNNKISAIREINSSINKSNDLDYKKAKDRAQSEAAVNDDKYIADLFTSFVSQPQNQQVYQQPQLPQMNPSLMGSSIIRANISDSSVPIDESYLNYMSNLTPEQNLMRYENDPNVKQVVVYDQASGNKFFQIMNVVTGEVIPNVEPYDTEMFMPDTTIDLNTRTAKNLNLNETFPVIVINETVASQY